MNARSRRVVCLLVLAILAAGCASSGGAPPLQWLEGARPTYPAAARADGVEGHVVLEYRVTADGTVEAPRVVESSPPGVFDGVALAAVRSWRYRPFDDGSGPRAVEGVRSRLEFRLGEAYPGL